MWVRARSSPAASDVYGITNIQIHQTGSFRWQVNDRQCLVTPLAGSGDAPLPFTQEQDGDTNAFSAPPRGVTAQVKDFRGNPRCVLRLFDAANGQQLDLATATPGSDTVTLDPNGRSTLYLNVNHCVVQQLVGFCRRFFSFSCYASRPISQSVAVTVPRARMSGQSRTV